MNESLTNLTNTDPATNEPGIVRIGQSMTRMRLMTGRRLIGRLAIQSVAPGLELSHLDVLDAVRRAHETGEVTVGTIAEMMRIDPSRASRIVADMVGRNILRRKASQTDARRIIVVMTPLGQRLLSEIRAQKLTFVSEVVKEWKPEEIEAFGELFEKFISGYEDVFQARIKDIVGEA